jgi:hypothetical protein
MTYTKKMTAYYDITLTEDEMRPALEFIDSMRTNKENNNVPDRMFDKNNTSKGIDIVGKLGEVAASKVLNLPVDYEIKTRGDKGLDFNLNGITIQVKTSTYESLIFNSLSQFKADVAMLVQFMGENKQEAEKDPRFRVYGWIDKPSFIKLHYHKNYGYGERSVVDINVLNPIETLTKDFVQYVEYPHNEQHIDYIARSLHKEFGISTIKLAKEMTEHMMNRFRQINEAR